MSNHSGFIQYKTTTRKYPWAEIVIRYNTSCDYTCPGPEEYFSLTFSGLVTGRKLTFDFRGEGWG